MSIETKRNINNASNMKGGGRSEGPAQPANQGGHQTKQIKILENRLDKANQKFNDLIS